MDAPASFAMSSSACPGSQQYPNPSGALGAAAVLAHAVRACIAAWLSMLISWWLVHRSRPGSHSAATLRAPMAPPLQENMPFLFGLDNLKRHQARLALAHPFCAFCVPHGPESMLVVLCTPTFNQPGRPPGTWL